jgi:hypothetical protein
MKPILFVCGLGRCGTSLTMQMLAAGGVPCVSRFPAFEHENTIPTRQSGSMLDLDWLRAHGGHAIKWLDPFRFVQLPADLPYTVIWLDRDPMEQSNSQAKFAWAVGGVPLPNRQQRKAVAARLPLDRVRSHSVLRTAMRKLYLRFENLIDPAAGVEIQIADFVAPDFGHVDLAAMSRCRLPRGPECQGTLDIEMSLVEKAQA